MRCCLSVVGIVLFVVVLVVDVSVLNDDDDGRECV